LLQNSGVTEKRELKSKFDALLSLMNSKRLDLAVKRKAYEAARQKLCDHYLRSKPTTLPVEDVKTMLKRHDYYCAEDYETKEWSNPYGKGTVNNFQLQVGGKVIFDRATGLMWQQALSADYMSIAKAYQYIRQLNAQKFAGFSDWRLPTLEEFMSLMEPKISNNLGINPVFEKLDHHADIWTADKRSASAMWVVCFYEGICTSTASGEIGNPQK